VTCDECGEVMANGVCDACARENAMYVRFAAETRVPPMWEGIASRLRARPRRRYVWRAALAIAAAVAVITIAVIVRAPKPPASLVSTRYQRAIAALEPSANANTALLADLTKAIGEAERNAAAAPNDPIAVTQLVAAYDAKLEVLRTATYER